MKILIITTISGTINSFLSKNIKLLIEMGFNVDIATSKTIKINDEIKLLTSKIIEIPFSRKFYSLRNIISFFKIKKTLKKDKYNIIHVHTPIASFVTRLAFIPNDNTKLIYTAHGFHFFKKQDKLIGKKYYLVEKLLSKKTDVLITINNEDYKIAKEKFFARSNYKINGVGFDIKNFQTKINENKLENIRFSKTDFTIVSVGELNRNKNHKVIIESLSILKDSNIKYIICGEGPYKSKLLKQIKKFDLENNVFLLGYCNNVNSILRGANLFAMPSFREGLPLSLLEAINMNLPIIASKIRGNEDLISHQENGYLIDSNDAIGFKNAILEVKSNYQIFVNKCIEYNKTFIQKYDYENVNNQLYEIYLKSIKKYDT
jgi:glycosyltransferase involved in cell wall biosynthesis